MIKIKIVHITILYYLKFSLKKYVSFIICNTKFDVNYLSILLKYKYCVADQPVASVASDVLCYLLVRTYSYQCLRTYDISADALSEILYFLYIIHIMLY